MLALETEVNVRGIEERAVDALHRKASGERRRDARSAAGTHVEREAAGIGALERVLERRERTNLKDRARGAASRQAKSDFRGHDWASPSPGSGSRSTWRARSAEALVRAIRTMRTSTESATGRHPSTTGRLGSFRADGRYGMARAVALKAPCKKSGGQSEPETARTTPSSTASARIDGQNRGSPWVSVNRTAVSHACRARALNGTERRVERAAEKELLGEDADTADEQVERHPVSEGARNEPGLERRLVGGAHRLEALDPIRERVRRHADDDPEHERQEDDAERCPAHRERLRPRPARPPSGEQRAAREEHGRLHRGGDDRIELGVRPHLEDDEKREIRRKVDPERPENGVGRPDLRAHRPRRCGGTPRLTTVSLAYSESVSG